MYKGLNAKHEVMRTPYLRTMMALTLIKGPLVDDWATDQVQELEDKVNDPTNPIGMDQEILWTEFKNAFDSNYSDLTKKQQAISALYHLRMQKDRFDDYVAAFKHYVKQAGYDLTDAATVRLFAMGIEDKLLEAILRRDTQPDTIANYITAAHTEIKKHQNRLSLRASGNTRYQWIGPAQRPTMPRQYAAQSQQYTHPNGRRPSFIRPGPTHLH
jgi:hypothetical protein